MNARYLLRPRADQDLEDHAFYLAQAGGAEIGHRFLIAAHETFNLLSQSPGIGWQPRLHASELKGIRIFSVSDFGKMLVFYKPLDGVIEVLRIVHGSRNLRQLFQRERLE